MTRLRHRAAACVALVGLGLTCVESPGAGRQLTGVYAPAATAPLPPDEAAKKMTLPEGFEARIFAFEPDVVNPVAMTWDERGRLWVVELYEYPLGAAPGTKPRDNVKILEDTDNDGRADKVTVFADGLNLATGVLIGHGGVYVGQAPHLLFMEDTDGDDKADKTTVVKTGFGLEDRHELLNGFTWGPDGYLYMTHGVFTHSKVKDPEDPNDDGVTMTAAVARFHPKTRKFEVFAEGTSNPWGVDFDGAGNAFVSACVIDHLYHMAPGGLYQRQAGTPPYPYAYELLPSIVDHKHFRAAYAGVQIYQGDQYPEEYRGTLLMGNIHDSSIHQDRLTPEGASFKASFIKDFVRANDGWFRPVSVQVGPDGAVWIMDWYDKYPCYQNANADPEGVDRAHGRIWRIVYTGKEPGKRVGSRPHDNMNLGALSSGELTDLLAHKNAWHRRTAQRILTERGEGTFGQGFHNQTPVHAMFESGESVDARLAALWTLHTMGELDEQWLDKAAEDESAAVRSWAARLTGERGLAVESAMARLAKLARDEDIRVRTSVAVAARQFVSSSLTVNTPPAIPIREAITGGVLSELWQSASGQPDRLFTFLYWMAAEPLVAYDPLHAMGFFAEDGAMRQMPFSGTILTKVMRRISDMGDPQLLSDALLRLKNLDKEAAPAISAALRGVLEGQRGRPMIPAEETVELVSKWAKLDHPDTAGLAQQLGTLWGDASALNASLATVTDSSKPVGDRVRAIESVRQQKSPSVRDAFLRLINEGAPEPVLNAAILGFGEVGGDNAPDALIQHWPKFAPSTRRTAAEVLSSRGKWAQQMLSAIESKTIALSDIPAPVIRNLTTTKDDYVRNRAAKVIGRFRESTPDKAQLIAEKKRMILEPGPVDFDNGREVARRACFTCHKLHGEGAEVGPDLTGVGRSSLDALLANIIDPNQLIGAGYENVEVETKDDRIVGGRLVENTEARVKIVSAGPKEEVIAKSDIQSKRVSQMSVMPEGLEQMPDEEFRNLVWFILNPPEDDKPLQIRPGDRKLTLEARVPGREKAVDLLEYVTDPTVRPYLHPVKDPSGRHVLTQDRPSDHVWQHGIFTGLHKVNGIDFWTEQEGKQRFVRLLNIVQEQDHAGWTALAEWVAPNGEIVLQEEQTVKVYTVKSGGFYNMDFDWTLRAGEKAVQIGRHDYGGFSVRMDYHPDHRHLNSNGHASKEGTANDRAAWCDVSRPFGSETYGIAVLDHPSNLGHPARWRVDAQGLINPSPSLAGDWSIGPKQSRTFHYRLTVHAGQAEREKLQKEFEDFASLSFQLTSAGEADGESVALWNPEWKLDVPEFEGSPRKLPEFAGRKNVLMTHPFSEEKPAVIRRMIEVPAATQTRLSFHVAAHDQGDWELRVFANDQLLKKQNVERSGDRWKEVSVDLTPFAGKKIELRLENAANNWSWEFGYWSELKIGVAEGKHASR